MTTKPSHADLIRDALATVSPFVIACRQDGATFVAELARADGVVIWPCYAKAPTETLAYLAAEQRYLVEEVGRVALSGATYVDKAEERLRRWASGDNVSG